MGILPLRPPPSLPQRVLHDACCARVTPNPAIMLTALCLLLAALLLLVLPAALGLMAVLRLGGAMVMLGMAVLAVLALLAPSADIMALPFGPPWAAALTRSRLGKRWSSLMMMRQPPSSKATNLAGGGRGSARKGLAVGGQAEALQGIRPLAGEE